MTRDEVIRLALEAGFSDTDETGIWVTDGYWDEQFVRFAALVEASDTALLRQALKALNYVGVDPIDREEWEETEAIITALRERLGEAK